MTRYYAEKFGAFLLLLMAIAVGQAQESVATYPFEPNADHPFGQLNPEAPAEVAAFAPLMGTCDCKSVSRINQQTWADTVDMEWTFKYIMNGMAVQDITLKADGKHSGSIRQYLADSSKWYVHYFSQAAPTTNLSVWKGNKEDEGNIVLYRRQAAPNGTDGHHRLTFSEISDDGFNWIGEWVNMTETFSYPTWVIHCQKRR